MPIGGMKMEIKSITKNITLFNIITSVILQVVAIVYGFVISKLIPSRTHNTPRNKMLILSLSLTLFHDTSSFISSQ